MTYNKILKILFLFSIIGIVTICILIFTQPKLPAEKIGPNLKPSPFLSSSSVPSESQTTTHSVTQIPTSTQTQTQIPTSSQTQIDIYWLTYRNEEFGFKFKYPQGYEVRVIHDPHDPTGQHLLGGIVFIGNNVRLNFSPNIFGDWTLETLANFLTEKKMISKEIIYVGGMKAVKAKLPEGERVILRGKSKKVNYLYTSEESHGAVPPCPEIGDWKYIWLYHFIYESKERPGAISKDVFDQIVASFEFIE